MDIYICIFLSTHLYIKILNNNIKKNKYNILYLCIFFFFQYNFYDLNHKSFFFLPILFLCLPLQILFSMYLSLHLSHRKNAVIVGGFTEYSLRNLFFVFLLVYSTILYKHHFLTNILVCLQDNKHI